MRLINRIFVVIGWVALSFVCLGAVVFIAVKLIGSGDDSGLEAKTDTAVAVVDLNGQILTSRDFAKHLQDAVKNEKIKAIVVRVESPGGSVGASEEIFRDIRNASGKKPVMCSMGNIAASGGLYASMGCKKIWANNGTLTGSIGVILMMPNVNTVMSNLGFGMTVVKSGRFKDAGSPFKPLSPEDQALMQSLVDRAFDQFVAVIAESRKLEVEAVRKFADGRIILGDQAVELGLVDGIGGVLDAAKAALEDAGVKGEPELVPVKKRQGLMALLGETQELPFIDFLRSASQFRLMYL